MASIAVPLESVVSVPLQVAVLDSGGIVREVNEGWRSFAAENGRGLPGPGTDYLSVCSPEQATGLGAVIAGRCDVFTAVCPCPAAGPARWTLVVALPLSATRPRRVAVLRLDVSALLPFGSAGAQLRARHHPEMLPADTLDAIVHAVEQSIARSMGRTGSEPETSSAASPRPVAPEAPSVTAGLPRRQKQVLALLGEGMSNAQIAGVLGISMNTAKLHVSAVLRRLGLDNRMQAVALGARLAQAREPVAALGAE